MNTVENKIKVTYILVTRKGSKYLTYKRTSTKPVDCPDDMEWIDYRDHTDPENPVPRDLPEWLVEGVDARWNPETKELDRYETDPV